MSLTRKDDASDPQPRRLSPEDYAALLSQVAPPHLSLSSPIPPILAPLRMSRPAWLDDIAVYDPKALLERRLRQAEEWLVEAVELDSGNAKARQSLGQVRQLIGQLRYIA